MKRPHALLVGALMVLVTVGMLFLKDRASQTSELQTLTTIEGTWSVSGDNDGFSWYLTYHFENGEYTMEGYPPIEEFGTYTYTELEPQHTTLTLFADPTEYNPDPTPETWDVWLSEDGTTMEVVGGYTYAFQSE